MATYADNFTGTAGSGLSGRTASGGWTWTLSGGTDLLTINASGKVNGAAGNVNTPRLYAIPSVGNDQFVEATLTPSGAGYYLGVRISLTSKTGYILRLDTSAILLLRWDSLSTLVSLGSFGSATSSDTVKLEAVGSNLKVYKNGVQVGSTIVDATYASGDTGLVHRTGLNLTDAYDDFVAGDVGGTQHDGAATLVGAGSLVLAAHIARHGSTSLSGAGALAASASVSRAAASALDGTGTVTAAAALSAAGAAALDGAGALTGSASRSLAGSASLNGTGTATATAARALLASTALSGAAGLTASAHASWAGAATFAGTGTLTASGSLGGTLTAAAALSGTGAFTASATITRGAPVSLAGTGSISAAYSVNLGAGATLVGAGALSALSRLEARSGAVLSAVGTMVAFGRSEAPRVATVSRPSFDYSTRRPVMVHSTRPRAVSMGRR